ncbi:hypothetical protein B0A48_10712 [Cryoendolithus antarcticus]|uniref:AB hydrolase-1 domain-containing protein n=1 Tax=Cryoendolithus antarcticus TaxID=1507870 RepID=A0A1V8SYC0_9PEZI|nr:hypothetical protein B0A48_10712 [Cryoendolithus antarcticus]
MLLRIASLFGALAYAQLQSQNTTFNSSYHLTPKQIQAANLSTALVGQVELALNFERSNNAGSLTQFDPFYDLPNGVNQSNLPPYGSILKVEQYTNTTYYTLPATLSMSRFLYVSETLNGSRVVSSAYVLWPYQPRKFRGLRSCSGATTNVFPVLGQAHGTTGQTQACAPSNIRSLSGAYDEPFTMALNGYAVVATDYAGLGIPQTPTPYFILPAHANDVFHAVAAAQSQWPDLLSKQFVVTGQSQGGGTAWAAAQRQAKRPVPGYLGTLAASPFTNILADINGEDATQVNIRVVGIAQGLNSVLANFTANQWLTPISMARLALLKELVGCSAVANQLFSSKQGNIFLRPGWNETEAASWYTRNVQNGGKPFAGPMLVIQGTSDGNAIESVTTVAVNQTCQMYPRNRLRYIRATGVGHNPIMQAAQVDWLDWIKDRFAGVREPEGCQSETIGPVRAASSVVKGQNWIILYDQFGI